VTVPRPIEEVWAAASDSFSETAGTNGYCCWTTITETPNGIARLERNSKRRWKAAEQNCVDTGRDIKAVDFGADGAWYINGVPMDQEITPGSWSWWGCTAATEKIKELTASPQSLQVSFGTDSCGGETYALFHGNNGYSVSGSLDDDLSKRLEAD